MPLPSTGLDIWCAQNFDTVWTSMKQYRLPQELICAIIDTFQSPSGYDDWLVPDVPTLRTCSLVCRSWLPLCQCPLFHTVIFTTTCCGTCATALSHSRRLDQILLNSLHLAGYIRELRLWDMPCTTSEKRWMATDETLPLVLRKLGSLQKLECVDLYWSTLTVDLRQSLYCVLQRPSITTLTIQSGHFRSSEDFSISFLMPRIYSALH
jgi:hypothetical protein